MITEDYVSFETAKLLKEKGFDEFCYYYYMENGSLKLTNWDKEHNFCPCPTLQMVMKWLRERHGIHLQIGITPSEYPEKYPPKYYVYVNNTATGKSMIKYGLSVECVNDLTAEDGNGPRDFDTYEEACNAGIKYCLENLI